MNFDSTGFNKFQLNAANLFNDSSAFEMMQKKLIQPKEKSETSTRKRILEVLTDGRYKHYEPNARTFALAGKSIILRKSPDLRLIGSHSSLSNAKIPKIKSENLSKKVLKKSNTQRVCNLQQKRISLIQKVSRADKSSQGSEVSINICAWENNA